MTVRFYTTFLLATDAYEAIKLSNNISSNQKNKKQKTHTKPLKSYHVKQAKGYVTLE